ncbi:MAG: hypothetical protein ACKVS6_13015 [Planctomycetota bacterium]
MTSRTCFKTIVILLIVTLSGFCSLVYQVVWDRSVRNNFGGDQISSTIVTGTFLLGLGLGALLIGRVRRKAFTIYAAVEVGIGAFAIISHWLIGSVSEFVASNATRSIEGVEGLRVPIVIGCILCLVAPCVLMGGTLPLMFQCFIRSENYKSSTVGWIYGANTLGAAIGTLAAPYYLLNRFSVPDVLQYLSIINFSVAAIIAAFSYFLSSEAVAPADAPVEKHDGEPVAPSWIFTFAFATGFISLAYEISIIRHLFVVLPQNPYNFAMVVAPFLVAIAAGSSIFTRFRKFSTRAAMIRIGWLAVASSISIVMAIESSYQSLFAWILAWKLSDTLTYFIYATILVSPPLLFLSAIFPILLRLAANTTQTLPTKTGIIYLVNSTGAFAGAIITQFIGYSLIGVAGVVFSMCILTNVLGASVLISVMRRGRALMVVFCLSIISLAGFIIYKQDTRTFLTLGHPPMAFRDKPQLIESVEGATGVSMLLWGPSGQRADVYVNGTYMSALPDHESHVKMESLIFAMPRKKNCLLLGLGGGGMVRELVKDPQVERIDAVDWSFELPAILQMPRADVHLESALRHPKVRIWRTDAKVAVFMYETNQFDIIIDNLTVPGWVGSTSIRSERYFSQVRRILKKDGFLIMNNYGTPDAAEAVRAGIARSFEHLWLQSHQTHLMASDISNLELDHRKVESFLIQHKSYFNIKPETLAKIIIDSIEKLDRAKYLAMAPIRDDELKYEFTYNSFWQALTSERR